MFLTTKPTDGMIESFLRAQSPSAFSYAAVGATRGQLPRGFKVDHNRIRLGEGKEVFERARSAVLSWQMFDIPWIQLCWRDTPINEGAMVAVLAHHFGFWSLNAAQIVYAVDQTEPDAKFGFAYGTLNDHIESGEERFSIEWHKADNSVWYDLLAFSRPSKFYLKLGYPVCRMMQRRFVLESQNAMLRATQM